MERTWGVLCLLCIAADSSHTMNRWFKASVVILLLSMIISPADIRGVTSVSQLEQLNKRYWYVCQDFTEFKYPHQPKRFPEIMMCLPEIRCIAGKSRLRL